MLSVPNSVTTVQNTACNKFHYLQAILRTIMVSICALVAAVPTFADPPGPDFTGCLEDACKNVKSAEEPETIGAFMDAVESCMGGSLTPLEVMIALMYYYDTCTPDPGMPVPIHDRCPQIVPLLEVKSYLTCAQKNDILAQFRCAYRFKCDDDNVPVPPPEPVPCDDCFYGPMPVPSPAPGQPGLGIRDNPAGQPLASHPQLAGVNLSNGAIERTIIDLALPSAGYSWTIGRSYDARQLDASGDHRNVNNYQGWNWMQISQPQLFYFSTGAIGRLTMVLDGKTQVSFIETAANSDVYTATGDGAGVIHYEPGSPSGTWTYYDQNGNVVTFIAKGMVNRLWKIVDPAGNTAYVGDETDIGDADTNGYDGSGRIILAFDTNGRQYDYTYSGSAIGGAKRLLSVVATESSVEVARVEYSYYGYTADGVADPKDSALGAATGLAGDLKLVRVTLPTSVSAQALTTKTHYRYYVEDSDLMNDRKGYEHTLKYIVGAEGVRRYEVANGPITAATAYDATITTYSSEYMEYFQPASSGLNKGRYVSEKFNNGDCGCGGGSLDGRYLFNYYRMTGIDEWTGSPLDYHASPAFRAQVTQPDGVIVNQYVDVKGLSTGTALIDGNGDKWLTKVDRAMGTGWTTATHSPAAVDNSTFNTSTGEMDALSTGLVQRFTYSTASSLRGFVVDTKISDGNGDQTLVSTTEYLSRSTTLTLSGVNVTLRRPFTQYSWVYDIAQTTAAESVTPTVPTGALRTEQVHTFWSNAGNDTLSLVPKSVTTILPKVAAEHHGRGTGGGDPAVISAIHLRKDGTPAFMRETAFDDRDDAVYTYTKYAGGLMVERVLDVQADEADIHTDDEPGTDFGITDMSASVGLGQKSLYEYDAQGRMIVSKMYAQMGGSDQRWTKVYYTKLSDGRMVALSIPKHTVSGGTTTCYGPVSYSVMNHRGGSEFSGLIGFGSSAPFTTTTALNTWIDSAQGTANPITAVVGSGLSLSQGSATIYDNAGGRVLSQRTYTDLSTPTHDETSFEYDNMGRVVRSIDPTGTINRTVYDDIGRAEEQWVGTSDTGWGTGGYSGNLFKTGTTIYDASSDGGNSFVTSRTQHVDTNSANDRTTTFIHDFRGRTVVVTNPVSPHSVQSYDNRRAVAAATYDSTTGFTAATNPVTTTTGRLSLSRSYFNARGQVYQQRTYTIFQPGDLYAGHVVNDTYKDFFVVQDMMYGPAGEIIQSRGSDFHRYNYDRLRRRTHDWTLAISNDWVAEAGGVPGHDDFTEVFDTVSNTTNVDGDTVLVESRVGYDDNRNYALVTAAISRHHDDVSGVSGGVTTGPLDTDTDGSGLTFAAWSTGDYNSSRAIKGRLHGITAMYYDVLDRPTTTAAHGTNGGSAYTFSSTEPTASTSTLIVTKRAYDKYARNQSAYDPRGYRTDYTYDEAGRMVATKSNAAGSGVDTVATHYVYTNGLRTRMWVDADLSGGTSPNSGDQITDYDYTSNYNAGSGPSLFAANTLLTKVVYPPGTGGSAEADRRVTYGYNGLGEQIYMEDQEGTEFATTFDKGGRETRRDVTYPGGTVFDDTIKAVTTTYTVRGLTDQVTQRGTSDAVLDYVRYSYDHAGNMSRRRQYVKETGTGQAFTWDTYFSNYMWRYGTTDSAGRTSTYYLANTTYPDGTFIEYDFSGALDTLNRRVSGVAVTRSDDPLFTPIMLASYRYNGEAELVEQRAHLSTASSNNRFLAQSSDDLDPTIFRTYPNIDRFDRVTRSYVSRVNQYTSPTPVTLYATFYDVKEITYDESSNIRAWTDDRWSQYSNSTIGVDGMNRLLSTSATAWQEVFNMDRLGNFTGTNSLNPGMGMGVIADVRTANTANQITSRSSPDATLPYYDKVGNLTDDDSGSVVGFTYTWDAFGRLVKVMTKDEMGSVTVAEYRYGPDNHRIAWRYPQADDTWYYPVYDGHWRMIGLYKRLNGAESAPFARIEERFYYHNAGLAGQGGSGYIDSVIARDDLSIEGEEEDTYLLSRWVFYGQNWRGDVIGLVGFSGPPLEHVRYSAYGRPMGIASGDWDGDGVLLHDASELMDFIDYGTAYPDNAYFLDFDLDGIIEWGDPTYPTYAIMYGLDSGGLDHLTSAANGSGNRKGYAGYEHDPVVPHMQLARHRWYRADLGAWTRRDPIGYVQTDNLYQFLLDSPLSMTDSSGLIATSSYTSSGSPCGSCGSISNEAHGSLLQEAKWKPSRKTLIFGDEAACQEKVDECKTDARVKFALQQCPQGDASMPSVTCVFYDSSNPSHVSKGGAAYYDCDSKSITIWHNRNGTKDEVCELMAHEIVHACDHRSDKYCMFKNGDCQRRFRAEYRAALLSSQCCPNGTERNPDKNKESYFECAKRLATESTNKAAGCKLSSQQIDYEVKKVLSEITLLPPCADGQLPTKDSKKDKRPFK